MPSAFARLPPPLCRPYDRLVGGGMRTRSLRLSMKRHELAAERGLIVVVRQSAEFRRVRVERTRTGRSSTSRTPRP